MKPYLLTYSQACSPMQVQYLLDDSKAIETWVSPLPYSAIVVSKLGINDLGSVIRGRIPGVWFMLAELKSDTVQGWLPADLWDYVNNPYGVVSRNLFASIVPTAPVRPAAGIMDYLQGGS